MTNNRTASIRPFIGSKDFSTSRNFYAALGFEETILEPKLSVFTDGTISFYLQDYYAKEWVDNTMIFVEVEDVTRYWNHLVSLDLPGRFPGARIVPIRNEAWGSECFVHDPAGILWHFGTFKR